MTAAAGTGTGGERNHQDGPPGEHWRLTHTGQTTTPQYGCRYADGQLKLEEINEGYADMRAGKNLRGVIVYDQ